MELRKSKVKSGRIAYGFSRKVKGNNENNKKICVNSKDKNLNDLKGKKI
jgi:hypothetical protein